MLDLFDEPLAILGHFDNRDRRLVQPLFRIRRLFGHFLKPSQVHRHEVAAIVRLLAVLDPLILEDVGARIVEARHVFLLKCKRRERLFRGFDFLRVNQRVVLGREVPALPILILIRLPQLVQVVEPVPALGRADEQSSSLLVRQRRADDLLPRFWFDIRHLVQHGVGQANASQRVWPVRASHVDHRAVNQRDVLVVDVTAGDHIPSQIQQDVPDNLARLTVGGRHVQDSRARRAAQPFD